MEAAGELEHSDYAFFMTFDSPILVDSQNKAVRELFEKYPVLEGAFIEMAHEVIRTAPWGLMWRVGLGSVLSVVDIITDVNVILNFRSGGAGQKVYYLAMLVSLGSSVLFQIILTIVQNKGRGGSALAKELFWTVLFLKSPRDAFKVRVTEQRLMSRMLVHKSESCIADTILLLYFCRWRVA